MPEAAPVITVTDHFTSPSAGLHAQSGSTEQTSELAVVVKATGDYACSQQKDDGDTYSNEYKYCGGGSPDIATALGVWLTTFGQVSNAKAMTEMRVHFEAGEAATVSIDGHQHDTNPHTTQANWSLAGIIPAASGVGVPTLITVAGTVTPVSADLTVTVNHQDKIGATGAHFWGQNVGPCNVALSVQYEGLVTAATAGNWLNIKIASANENSSTPTSSVTAEQFIAARN